MVKKPKKDEEKPKESPFKKFLKKRAPVYLAVMAIVIIFIIPELTKSELQSILPTNLTDEEKFVFETLMSYNGPDKEGLRVIDAISKQIEEKYPNEKIYDNKKTLVEVSVTKLDEKIYQVIFDFQSYKDNLHYEWEINIDSGKIKGVDEESRYIIGLVDFYD